MLLHGTSESGFTEFPTELQNKTLKTSYFAKDWCYALPEGKFSVEATFDISYLEVSPKSKNIPFQETFTKHQVLQ